MLTVNDNVIGLTVGDNVFGLTVSDHTCSYGHSCYCTGACRQLGYCPNGGFPPYYYQAPYFNQPYQMGWVCPKCNSVNAPFVAQCPCGNRYTVTCDSTGNPSPTPPGTTCEE